MFPFCTNRFPSQRGSFPEFGNLSASAPQPGMQVPSPFLSSSFSLLFSILPSYAGIFIVLSSVQGLLLVFQPVFCENCCIYRCIPAASMERDELHVHLLYHHLESPQKDASDEHYYSIFMPDTFCSGKNWDHCRCLACPQNF